MLVPLLGYLIAVACSVGDMLPGRGPLAEAARSQPLAVHPGHQFFPRFNYREGGRWEVPRQGKRRVCFRCQPCDFPWH